MAYDMIINSYKLRKKWKLNSISKIALLPTPGNLLWCQHASMPERFIFTSDFQNWYYEDGCTCCIKPILPHHFQPTFHEFHSLFGRYPMFSLKRHEQYGKAYLANISSTTRVPVRPIPAEQCITVGDLRARAELSNVKGTVSCLGTNLSGHETHW